MKLKFEKNKEGGIFIKVDGNNFSTNDYINMIKEIKDNKQIEAEFGGDITEEEKIGVWSMLNDINKIKEIDYTEGNEVEEDASGNGEDISVEDIPF